MTDDSPTPPMPSPPAGWYRDPEGSGDQFWDGSIWTDQRRPSAAGPPPPHESRLSSAPENIAAQGATANGMAVAGLVLGIVGLVLCWVPVLGWILGVLAIVFGAIGRNRAIASSDAQRKNQGTAGLILGIVTMVAATIIVVLVVNADSDTARCIDNAATLTEAANC